MPVARDCSRPQSTSDLQVNVGLNVRAHREHRGLSQHDLGKTLGVHAAYVGFLERGEINLTLARLERMARGLGIDPLQLLIPRSSR